MTQPPGGYPPPEPGDQHPPPADPFYAPPSWEPPTVPMQSSYPPPPPPPPPSSPGGPYPPPPPSSPGGPYPPPPSPYDPPGGPYAQPPSPYGQPGATVPMSSVPGSPPPYGPPPYGPYGPSGPPPRRRRRGLVIGIIALAGALVLCAGGGVAAWLLTRDPDRNGADSPTVAVQSFLQAVYHDQDAGQASDLVCSEARDQASLQTKIDEIQAYQETLASPTFEWTEPTVVEETDELAVVAVTVTLTTADEKTADQNLRVSVLDKQDNGWWVCDLASVEDAGTGATPPPSGTPPPSETPSDESSPDDGE